MVAYISTEQTVTSVVNGKTRVTQIKSKAHRNEIIAALEVFKRSPQGYEDLKKLEEYLAPIKRITLASDSRFELDEAENSLFLSGTTIPIPPQLANKIVDFLNSGLPVDPLVKFWESCLRNPHYVAVTELFDFLERNNLPITNDGAFLGYKKLNFTNRIDIPDDFEELIIDGSGEVRHIKGFKVSAAIQNKYLEFINESNNPLMKDVYSGKIPQKLGDVVKIDRIKLNEAERREACGYGLHIGAFGYGFSGNVRVVCKVFPEDVIACNPNEQKLRTCRYQIVSFVDEKKEIAEMLVNFSKEPLEHSTQFKTKSEVFNPGDTIRCIEVPDEDLILNRYYFVIDAEEDEVLILDERGVQEWYSSDYFTAA